MTGFRYLTEADIAKLVALPDAIDALEETLLHQADGTATAVPKAMAQWDGGSLHALASVDQTAGLAGVKSWINTPSGAVAVMLVFDSATGALAAVIEAGVLGALRTAGISAIATKRLAAPDPGPVAIIGSGRQAFLQLAAILTVRPSDDVRVWSPTPEKRAMFAARATALFGRPVTAVETLVAACEDAAIIATVTRAHDPFLTLDHCPSGVHVNAVGAILKGSAELHPEVVAAADVIAADDVATAIAGSTELITWQAGGHDASRLHALASITSYARPAAPRLTLFKSMGMGLSDLAVAGAALRGARAAGIGEDRPAPSPVLPRWSRT